MNISWDESNSKLPSLVIERIEFKIVRGDNDATGVKIKALYTDKAGKQKQLDYPKDYPEHNAPSFPLEQLKPDNQLLSAEFKTVFMTVKQR